MPPGGHIVQEEPQGGTVRRIALGIATALMLAAFPIASSSTVGAAATDTSTSIHVINALGNTGTDTAKTTTGPNADVTLTCGTTQTADISVVDPNGTASDGSHTFVIPDGAASCDVSVHAVSTTDHTGFDPVETNVDCSISTGFSSSSYYKLVIEPIYTTLEGTDAAAFPLALTDCAIHKWQDDTSILPNGYARFTVRHAACLTGTNLHITSVTANGDEVLGPIDSCNDATVELPEGVYHFVINISVDPNGDSDFDDAFTVFSPNPQHNGDGSSNDPATCDQGLGDPPNTLGSTFSGANCPIIDESAGQTADLGNISLAHGQAFVFNFVDNESGSFVPYLTGGDAADSEILVSAGDPDVNCDTNTVNLGGVYGPTTLGGVNLPMCNGGGLGVIAGASTAQVQFVPNQLPESAAATAAFCTALLGPPGFSATTTAETDYIATLTVVDKTDTKLEGLVDDTDALIQQLLATAPLEIRPQIVILTNGLQALNEGLRAASFNTATLGADALDQIQSGLANPTPDPETEAATAVLTAWVPANCFPAPVTPATPVPVSPKFTG